jgi:hypothetical protein
VSERPDKVKIPVVRRNSDGKWEVDVAKIDAVLSLWMASIEAKTAKDAKDAQQRRDARRGLGKGRLATDLAQDSGDPLPDWRRIKVGDDSRRTFGRIIGDSLNGELKRDISWWFDSIIAELSRVILQLKTTTTASTKAAMPRAMDDFGAEQGAVVLIL